MRNIPPLSGAEPVGERGSPQPEGAGEEPLVTAERRSKQMLHLAKLGLRNREVESMGPRTGRDVRVASVHFERPINRSHLTHLQSIAVDIDAGCGYPIFRIQTHPGTRVVVSRTSKPPFPNSWHIVGPGGTAERHDHFPPGTGYQGNRSTAQQPQPLPGDGCVQGARGHVVFTFELAPCPSSPTSAAGASRNVSPAMKSDASASLNWGPSCNERFHR